MAPPIPRPLPIIAEGDLVVGGVAGLPERLAVGADNADLAIVNGRPTWRDGKVTDVRDYIDDWSASAATFNTYWQAAITAAAGGTLVVPEGAYKLDISADQKVYVSSNTTIQGLPGNVITATGGQHDDFDGTGFVVRDSTGAKENITFEGLNFVGDNDPFVYQNSALDQSTCIRLYCDTTTGTKNIWVRRCTFQKLWGFSVQFVVGAAAAYTPRGMYGGVTDCLFYQCKNGMNVSIPYGQVCRNMVIDSEGWEGSSSFMQVNDNLFYRPYGAISMGGDNTAGRPTYGMQACNNLIFLNRMDVTAAIILAENSTASLIQGNTIYRSAGYAIYAPVDTDAEETYIINNVAINTGYIIPTHATSHAYVAGDLVIPSPTNGYFYLALTSGTTAGSAPTWPTGTNSTVVDGGVTWERRNQTQLRAAFLIERPYVRCIGNTCRTDTLDTAYSTQFGILLRGSDGYYDFNKFEGTTWDIQFSTTNGSCQRNYFGPGNQYDPAKVNFSSVPTLDSAFRPGSVMKFSPSGTGARPAAAIAYRHLRAITEGGAGVADTDAICQKDGNDTYAWDPVTIAPVTPRTATVAGATTGTIAQGTLQVAVTSSDVNHIIILPAPVVGAQVTLRNGGTGYELRTSDPATIAINGGTGAAAESAIPANTLVVCRCDTATTWVCTNYDTDGSISVTEVAAP